MKNSNVYRKLVITVVFIIVAAITAIILIYAVKNKSNTPEKVAKAVLTRTYGVTLQDYEDLIKSRTDSLSDNNSILNYLRTVYGEQLTDNGYQIFLNNRIPSIATNTAHEQNSNLKVSSIKLESKDAVEGSKRYAFTIQVQTEKDATKTLIYKGNIMLIKEKGQWKVDGVSPD